MSRFDAISDSLDLRSTGKWLLLCAIVGLLVGLTAILFEASTQILSEMAMVRVAGLVGPPVAGELQMFDREATIVAPAAVVLVTLFGGLLAGAITPHAPKSRVAAKNDTAKRSTAPHHIPTADTASGNAATAGGTNAVIDAFHNRRGQIPTSHALRRGVASVITLGMGGSAGREGPIAQLGAWVGSRIATTMNCSDRDRRILLAAGIGAGVGAVFRAPLAGALFAAEVLYRDADLDSDVIVPAAMASSVGYSVYSIWLPESNRHTPMFGDDLRFHAGEITELVPYALLAVLLSIAIATTIQALKFSAKFFHQLKIPIYARGALGMGLAGMIGVGLYFATGNDKVVLTGVLTTGYGVLQNTVVGDTTSWLPIQVLLLIGTAKIITTALTVGPTGAGGVFGPSMVIGGCLGGATGQVFQQFWPTIVTQPHAFAVVGMAGFFAGAARTPISTVVMVTELTGDYQLLVPTIWVSTLCFLLSTRVTLYPKQVRSRVDSPAHRGDFIIDVLEGMKVRDVFTRDTNLIQIPDRMKLKGIVHTLAMTSQRYFPVVNDDSEMIGIFSADDVRAYVLDRSLWELANATDVMVGGFTRLSPNDDLNVAMQKFTRLNVDELPVMSLDNPKALLGMLRRKEAIAAYNRRVVALKSDDHGEA